MEKQQLSDWVYPFSLAHQKTATISDPNLDQ
jgi:hypothetical protein